MCTALNLQTQQGHHFFGRTMDFSYPLDPELYIVPKGYEWGNLVNTHTVNNAYSFIGIGQDISPVTFADGVNEKGFAVAALYFPGFAQYDPVFSKDASVPAIAALEVVKLLLGLCASVKQAAGLLKTVRIVGIKDAITDSIAPLHWIAADAGGACMVIEKTAEGLHLIENPIGVLSNSPDFQWQMTNLRNYMNVTPSQQPEAKWNGVSLTPFGQGAGGLGLPGDYSPPSRFVRAAYQKSHTDFLPGRDEAVIDCFHILESVSIPKGVVMTARKTSDYTQYTAFMDLSTQEYFFNTYQNPRIMTAPLLFSGQYGSEIISLGKLKRPVDFGQMTHR